MAPLQAVYKHVPKLPQLGPEDPGPFAFASEARVKRILGEAGFSGIAMEPCKVELDIATGRGIDAAIQGALEIGPASRALEGHPEEVRAAAIASMREALGAVREGCFRAAAGRDLDRDRTGFLSKQRRASYWN